MELKINNKNDEALLSRIKINAEVTYQGATPSKEQIKKQIATSLKVDEKVIVIKNVRTFFGQEKAQIAAFQYETEDALKKIEPKKKSKANQEGAAEAPKEEPKKEAAPKDVPKEEAK